MDFYERKKKAKILIRTLIGKDVDLESIKYTVEEQFNFSERWIEQQYNKIKLN